MSYIKIDGSLFMCKVLSNKTVNNKHQLSLSITGNNKALRELLHFEKHGSCWIDFEQYACRAVLIMTTNKTIRLGSESLTESKIIISWVD